jgi:AcrR family transcriptional regulator
VAAGVDLVTQEGIQSLSLREIARRAGVSHGAPRRYFPTHLELLSSIARHGFAELGTAISEALDAAPGDPRSQLVALSRAYVGYARSHRGMFELMVRHDLLESGYLGLRDAGLPLFETLVDLLLKVRPDLMDRGEPQIRAAAGAYWASLHGIAQLWLWGSLGLATGLDDVDPVLNETLDRYLGPENNPSIMLSVGGAHARAVHLGQADCRTRDTAQLAGQH